MEEVAFCADLQRGLQVEELAKDLRPGESGRGRVRVNGRKEAEKVRVGLLPPNSAPHTDVCCQPSAASSGPEQSQAERLLPQIQGH